MAIQPHDPKDENADPPDYEWPYWHLEFPGLSEERALKILELAQQAGLSFGGHTSNPREQMIWSLDRATAQWLLAALAEGDSMVLNYENDALELISPQEARNRVEGLREDLKEFIDDGDAYEFEQLP